jgi:hypothetical protein
VRALSIQNKFRNIIIALAGLDGSGNPISGISIIDQFRPGETGDISAARNMNAAFLALLAGPGAPGHDEARHYLEGMAGTPREEAARFLSGGCGLAEKEIVKRYGEDALFRESIDSLHEFLCENRDAVREETIGRLWDVFFPEGVISGSAAEGIAGLREKRTVRVTSLNPEPVRSPGREVLFTANLLLTVPSGQAERAVDPGMRDILERAAAGEQAYWYDHPIPLGASPDANELIHGLTHFSRALAFEEAAGTKDPARNIDCVISVSVTHHGLRGLARPWIESVMEGEGGITGINLHVFTEDDTVRLIEEILLPAAEAFNVDGDGVLLRDVFGVDGEYGRHYSFLKAIARIWSALISPEIRATFKIDLDQVFPQEELARVTGTTAFGLLRTPLWGARGVDSGGNGVYLGMIAGALVNRGDIGVSLFTPDVPFPSGAPPGDEAVFRSAVPQALSTAAEMMTRYGPGGGPDGASTVIQRVHVTGGTTGILVEALRRYRPFTPTCIGRAEDQAYLLSVLFNDRDGACLRYAHVPGLIMRHDADLFSEAADSSRAGKSVGDYVRIMFFSDYAGALPWRLERIKDAVDPFTGCFISRIPITLVYLRFALKAARLFASDDPVAGLSFFNGGVRRLAPIMESHKAGGNPLVDVYEREKRGWDFFHDILDILEIKIAAGDPAALALMDRARAVANSVRVTTGASS